jgi:hypothetical protein
MTSVGEENPKVHLQNDHQKMILEELEKGPVKNLPKDLKGGSNMEYLVECRYVMETAEPANRASYEITDAGRAALAASEGGAV